MRNRRAKRVEARVFDESGPLVAVWFNQPWIARELTEARRAASRQARQCNQFWVKNHELLERDAPSTRVGRVPVHPATQGHHPAPVAGARQRSAPLARAARRAAARRGFGSRRGCPSARPRSTPSTSRTTEDDEQAARRRLAFEELFLLQLAVAGRRRARREGRQARPLAARGVLVDRWRWSLPFELTGDQAQRHRGDRRRPRRASGRCSGC